MGKPRVRMRWGPGLVETRRPGVRIAHRPSPNRVPSDAERVVTPDPLRPSTHARVDRALDAVPAAAGPVPPTRRLGIADMSGYFGEWRGSVPVAPAPAAPWEPPSEVAHRQAVATRKASAKAARKASDALDGKACPFEIRCLCPGGPHR